MAFSMRAACSGRSNEYRSIIAAERIMASGFAKSFPAMSGAEPCDGSNKLLPFASSVNQLRAAGHTIANQNLARVSPLIHTHVIPNSTYRFPGEEEPERMYAAAT